VGFSLRRVKTIMLQFPALERLSKVFFVSCWLRHRPAARDCIDNPHGLPASSSLPASSWLRLKAKELSTIALNPFKDELK
jgi:hypothetical protein